MLESTFETGGGEMRTGFITLDVAVVRDRPFPAWPWIVSTAMDLAAGGLLFVHGGTFGALLVAAGIHLLAALPVLATTGLTASERALGAALVLGLPVVGASLGALALGTVGQSQLTDEQTYDSMPSEPLRADELRRLGEALPCCEALLAGTVEERRAIIATLTRRADADAVALLRWALGAPDPDLAVEAALAIEEMTASFEGRLAAYRTSLEDGADSATPAAPAIQRAAAELITQAIDAGVADPALIPVLARDARRWYQAAEDGEPSQAGAVAIGRARLELAVLRPDTALAYIDRALGLARGERGALLALREEAVLASHSMPWEGPSALATYHTLRPPPLTARRRYAIGGSGVGSGVSARPAGSAPRRLTGRGTSPAAAVPQAASLKIGPVQVPAPASSTHEVSREGR